MSWTIQGVGAWLERQWRLDCLRQLNDENDNSMDKRIEELTDFMQRN